MIDKNMERWIRASINKYFVANKDTYSLFAENQEIAIAELKLWTELRINGPRFATQLKNQYQTELELNLACSIKLDGNDVYGLDRMVGHFRSLCEAEITINKVGPDTAGVDTGAFIGCLTLRNTEPHPIDVIPWGQIQLSNTPVRVFNTTIDAYMKMDFVS